MGVTTMSVRRTIQVGLLAAGLLGAGGAFGADPAGAALRPGPGVRVEIHGPADMGPRVRYGVQKLQQALEALGCEVGVASASPSRAVLHVRLEPPRRLAGVPESFALEPGENGWRLQGEDETGLLYACLELAERLRRDGTGPAERLFDSPALRLRGVCVGLQKTTILPGRQVYEYPWTPELFPWFYDRALWTEFLDFLVRQRFNTLYLWNGHPFGSIVRVPEYPEGIEVPPEVFSRNVDMMTWLANECDRRGIWLVVMFYNILLPQPLAEKHGLPTQLDRPHPVAADYTRRAIARFIESYPHVGLLVCLGEALQGTEHQLAWATNVILPAVKEGARAAGLHELPPLIVRTHATDAERVLPACFAHYTNLFTMTKFNGESLTVDRVRGRLRELHRRMAALGPHLVNVHILANLEPFRYFAPAFIQRCVQGARDDLGAAGLHLYPLCYWNWPHAPDRVTPALKQWERDWPWFEAWARYAWNPDRPEVEEREYWRGRIMECFGCDGEAADRIVEAGNAAGLVAPMLLRRFGITEGNRQTLALGMTLDQLVHPERYQPVRDLWECLAPEGERLQDSVAGQLRGEPGSGETPWLVRLEAVQRARRAVALVEGLAERIGRHREEFLRWQNDLRALEAMARCYAHKAGAAEIVLRSRATRNARELLAAADLLEASLRAFEELTHLAGPAYWFANSLQTGHRRIPYPGVVRGVVTNFHWSHVLPLYRAELEQFRERVRRRLAGAVPENAPPPAPWRPARVKVTSERAETYEVRPGARPFTDRSYQLVQLAPELVGLTGIRFSHEEAKNGRYQPVEFEVEEPVQVLLGLFRDDREIWLQPPNVDAAAHWAEQGSPEPVLRYAARVEQCPVVDVYVRRFPAGRNRLTVPGRGSFVVLGVVPQTEVLHPRDVEEDWP